MLNWCKYFFVSGDAYFVGAVLIVLACLFGLLIRAKWAGRVVPFLMVIGFILLLLSTTPISGWYYWIGIPAAIVSMLPISSRRRLQAVLQFWVLVWMTAGVVVEWPHRQMVEVPGRYKELYVIGDSVSQGIGREALPWPDLLAQEHQVKVINLAVCGATVESAMSQAEEVGGDQTLVVLEIGGNDLLGSTSPPEFEFYLDQLLRTLRGVSGRTLVMFELPLFPNLKAFGVTQRELARKYQVILIPKRYLASVLYGRGMTVDGIHLSDLWHQRMADMVWSLLGNVD